MDIVVLTIKIPLIDITTILSSMRCLTIVLAIIACAGALRAQSHYHGQHSTKLKVADTVTARVRAFDLKNVRLLESRFKDNMNRNGAWLLSISSSRLLHNFRVNAGLPTSASAFGGWEKLDVELRGHTIGHVLSGLSMMFVSTGEQRYKLKADSLVAGLLQCQQTLGSGYLSAFPENLINRAIKGEPVWAPWYTIHKIIAGLLDVYLYTDNDTALRIASNIASWAYQKLSPLSNEQLAVMLKQEFGGMNEVFYNLFAITNDEKHERLARMFYHEEVLDPLSNRIDNLKGLHANTQIPKIIGQARRYELTGEQPARTSAEFFWETVINHQTYANGGNSDYEHFIERDQISKHLSPRTTETCNTYNMLKLTNHIFQWTGDTRYVDYYERALYNHILAAQDPKSGMASYFMPMKPGMFKVYSTKENSFWCCVGSAFESNSKFGEAIYFHDENSVYVNLFIPSELTWDEIGVNLLQESSFPEKPETTLTVRKVDGRLSTIFIRYPSWATGKANLTINGRNFPFKQSPGHYIELRRKWSAGDKIVLKFPMKLEFIPTPDNPNVAAIAYGPILLAGEVGADGLTETTPYVKDQNDLNNFFIPSDLRDELDLNGQNDFSWLKPLQAEPLAFKSAPEVTKKEIIFRPYYSLTQQRYVVYWQIKK
jgi:uncharacterized protein